MRILLTTTSFQDTPGRHHDVLTTSGYEIVRARGPLTEAQLLLLLATPGADGSVGFDGLLNGDDAITAHVIDAAAPRLKVIAKYGIGLDSIDVAHATARGLAVLFTPGVNHTTVAEHSFGLMIALAKHFWPQLRAVKGGMWTRITGSELAGKTLVILGLGRIGKEVAKRARAFEMNVRAYDRHWDDEFATTHGIARAASADEAIVGADVVSLHMGLDAGNRGFINAARIATMNRGALVINTARGALVDEADVVAACVSGALGGYGTDVLANEPPAPGHVFETVDNIIVTPHVGSRTNESVERQGLRAVRNIVNFLRGDADFIQAN